MMPRPRRAGLAIVVLFLSLVAFVSAAPDLDDCALRCVTISATTACNIDSFRCVCQTFANPVRSCISTICPGADGTTARTQFEQACSAEGVTITSTTTTTTPPAPTNPTTPSTSDPPKDTTTEDPPPASDVPTGSPGATDTSNPSAPNNSSPVQTNIGNNDNDGDSDAGGSSIGSLIGAIVGGLIGGLLVVALVWFILRRRRRRFLDDDGGGVLAYSVARTDNMSYMNEPKHDSSQPILMDDFSSHKYSTSGSGFNPLTGSPSPHSSPAPAGVPFARGPGSTADSQGSYAARPVIFDTDQQYLPRKGDPPRVHVIHTGSSIAPESVAGSSSRGGDGRLDAASPIRGPADDSASVALTSASAQELTPEQLNLVQTMVNRGLPGTAVVDVIQRMLADNQAVPPEYRPNEGGTLLPPPLTPALGPPPPLTPGIPPPPLTPAAPASATSGSSTQLPYRQSRS